MLCACSRGHKSTDNLSLYNYGKEDRTLPPTSHRLPLPGTTPGPGHSEDDWSDVLMSDQSYPGPLSCLASGAWNPAFDSGIESGEWAILGGVCVNRPRVVPAAGAWRSKYDPTFGF